MSELKNSVRFAAINMLTMPNLMRSVDAEYEQPVKNLREKGHHSFGKVFSSEECATLRSAIDEAVKSDRCKFSEHMNYHVIHSPLKLDDCLTKALSKEILETVENYFRRKAYLADVDCRRVYPSDKETIFAGGSSSSNWHKDVRGRQLKLMVYLTDVGPDDSSFAFVPGSHGRRTFEYSDSRFTDDDLQSIGAPVDWFGEMGEGMLFDTNLVHRLTRRSTASVRDTITFYFTPGQSLRNLDANNRVESIANLCRETSRIFRRQS